MFWSSAKVYFVTHHFHNLDELDGQAQPRVCQTDECFTIGRCKTSQVFFADDLVLLTCLESGLQHGLNGFSAACDVAELKTSSSKTEVLHLSRNSVQSFLQFGGASLKQVEKFKYLRVAFTRDRRQDEK